MMQRKKMKVKRTEVALVANKVDDVVLQLHGEEGRTVERQLEHDLQVVDPHLYGMAYGARHHTRVGSRISSADRRPTKQDTQRRGE
jgi:hypothetical protein